ncbi:MAG: glycine/betaine/sarcosine/D-proline family reductase selenoprotein B [Erysipelotrichaceae bacterium]|nr:glycine/betaine/sarcosine/D-proline family reductase selenoprotein B [Erysipelotrichaceae bacterium]
MKVLMIYDQIQAGVGTKDDKMVPLGGKKEAIGPAIMMEPFLKAVNGEVIACLHCGNGTYLADPEDVSKKLCAMVKKMNPDVVMCGPSFNFADYSAMGAKVAYDIMQTTGIPAMAAMSEENADVIAAYKDKVNIVITPKKGGTGLNDALRNMCKLAQAMVEKEDTTQLVKDVCFS